MVFPHSWICAILMVLCLASSAAGWRRELTTRSWDVIGFHENLPHSPQEDQLIIAVVDTGIRPDAPSFDDTGLGPPPAKWKGICDPGSSSIPFKCNNKIIGARMYYHAKVANMSGQDRSPRDTEGHGTHVAATIAGVPVKNAGIEGIGLGTARGAVPRARLAVYKACWGRTCPYKHRGIHDAILDGADLISVSIGGMPWPYHVDGSAVETFRAMRQGIIVSLGAGNNFTFNSYTVNNDMPWVMTVASSSGAGTDYVTHARSGDGKQFEGTCLHLTDHGKTMYPLILNREVTNASKPEFVDMCDPQFMNPEAVRGKIILCEKAHIRNSSVNIDDLGIAGLLVNSSEGEFQYNRDMLGYCPKYKTPTIFLKGADYSYLVNYYLESNKTGQTATANIAKTTNAPDTPARSSYFTNRGPNLVDLNILKPDISAPGTNQIAAAVNSSLGFIMKSGTSMATPFLNGVAAYVKSFHPTWSPAAIKSALMTTATPMTDIYKNASELAYGAGQVDPLRATDPGLVYEIGEKDYIKYLCQFSNGSNELLYRVTNNSKDDCANIPIEKNWQLNYPAFSVPVFTDQPFVKVLQRTVTNVGNASASNYKAVVSAPKTLTVKVEPSVLAFTQVGQALSYTLTVEGVLPKRSVTHVLVKEPVQQVLSASLVWTDGSHHVRTPIVVFERPVDLMAQRLETTGLPYPT